MHPLQDQYYFSFIFDLIVHLTPTIYHYCRSYNGEERYSSNGDDREGRKGAHDVSRVSPQNKL